MSALVQCEACGNVTTALEANDRATNTGRCQCGGHLWPLVPRKLAEVVSNDAEDLEPWEAA